MNKSILVAIFSIFLTSCASVSEVSNIGTDTYTVASSMSGNFPSWPEVKELAIKKANAFCDTKNKQMTVVDWDTHGARGWTPLSAELKFKCLPKETQATNTSLPAQGAPAGATPVTSNSPSATDRLNELGSMHKRGLITDNEYQQKKKQILDNL